MNPKISEIKDNEDQKSGYDRLIRKLKQECGTDPRIEVLIKEGFAAFLKML